jgi:hypothetical protein
MGRRLVIKPRAMDECSRKIGQHLLTALLHNAPYPQSLCAFPCAAIREPSGQRAARIHQTVAAVPELQPVPLFQCPNSRTQWQFLSVAYS